ncbi:MAG: FHA domain-containing protein [Clostridiales bacterium]|nr:FHA domain-containing protein [Clostridiales bacterium]
MIRFYYPEDKNIAVDADENDELQLCPVCTLPNLSSVSECIGCTHSFVGEDNDWHRASAIVQCPDCSCYCAETAVECPNCGRRMQKTDYLICPKCKTKNPQFAEKCSNPDCGASLEDVDPISDSDELSDCVEVTFMDARSKKTESLIIQPGTYTLVGREENLSGILRDYPRVSRLHLLIGIENQNVYIVDLSQNGTYIGAQRAERGSRTPLLSGTTVTLGVPLGAPEVAEAKAAMLVISYGS